MPDVTPQEMDVSFYWSTNYDPVMDVEGTGIYLLENGQIGSMVQMTDGSIWFDHDDDGWFDIGRRLDEDGSVHEYNGRWRKLGNGEDMETINGALVAGDGGTAGLENSLIPISDPSDWMFNF